MIDILERLKIAARAANDSELARELGVSQQSVANARTKKNVPSSWLPKAATLFSVSLDWLYYGRGPMCLVESAPPTSHRVQDSASASVPLPPSPPEAPQPALETPPPAPESAPASCTKLEAELERERHERRELTATVRQMTAQNHDLTSEVRSLWKENGELREKCARLEERQYQRSVSRDGGEALGSA